MSSWYSEEKPSYSVLDAILLRLLTCGPVPNHVAFIMDGNRRFARANQIKTFEGHSLGFDKMAEVLMWCDDLGIKEITVYAFSIENFKRSEEEVSALLNLAREKFRRLIGEEERLRALGVRVNVIGKLDVLPSDLQELIDQAESMTRTYETKRVLNVAFAYTSRDEMTHAIRTTARAVHEGLLEPEDITEELLEECMYAKHSKVDLLIRTSGEVRLSDFLLWQSAFSVIYFTPVFWPAFAFRNLLAAVFYYQCHYWQISKQTSWLKEAPHQCDERSARVKKFLLSLQREQESKHPVSIAR